MICPNCGNEGDGVFCAVCGAKLHTGHDMELNPAARRRAAEKAAEEAEAMRRRYEEAAEAAKAMLRAVEAEETAAAKARAEREESLRRAVTEAEALLSEKTVKLAAAQSEQKAAERLLAERRAAIAEYQTTGKISENTNPPVYSGWTSHSISQSAAVKEPIRQSSNQLHDFTQIQPDIGRIKQDSPWTPPDEIRRQADNRISPEPPLTHSGTPQSWIDTSSRMEPVRQPEPSWAGTQNQNNSSPWTAPPAPNPRWTPGSDPTQSEIWNTIVNNTPREPEAENVLRKAAGYWKDQPPVPAADRISDVRAPQQDHKIQNADIRSSQPDPWGVGNNNPSGWQVNEQQRVRQTDQAAFVPRASVKQREEKGKRSSKTHDDDFDEDNETEYEDDFEDEEEEEEEEVRKPSFFKGLIAGLKLSPSKRKNHNQDEDDDEEDYEDEDDLDDEEYADDDEDEDEDSEEGGSSLQKKILIGLGLLVIIIGLSFLIGKLLKGTFSNLMNKNEPANTQATDSAFISSEENTEMPAPVDPMANAPVLDDSMPPSIVDPEIFAEITVSAVSMSKNGNLVYCSNEPPGVYLMLDNYTESAALTDMAAYNTVYDYPWIYFSTQDGIYRIRQDDLELQKIIDELYEEAHNFYVYRNYLYYTHMYPEYTWNLNRYNLDAADNPEAIAEPNEELINNIDPNFFIDGYGVYTFADESIEHGGILPVFSEPVSPHQTTDEGQRRKNIFIFSFLNNSNYLIGRLYMDKFVTSRKEGVLVQTTEEGIVREYMIAWIPQLSDYTSREEFTGPDGALYQLHYNERGSYALLRSVNDELEIVADDIEPDVYSIINNNTLYYLTTTENYSYKLMKYDFNSQEVAPTEIIDFGLYDQDMIDIEGKLARNDVTFDKISLADSGGDIINFAGLVITAPPDRRLNVINRTNGEYIVLSPSI